MTDKHGFDSQDNYDDVDFNAKLDWYQKAFLLLATVSPLILYIVNIYTHFLY